MSGQPKLQNANERMDAITQALDDYEKGCGLPASQMPCDEDELSEYFNMDRGAIEKLSGEDCGQIAYRLSQVSFYLQRCINREEARLAWANSTMNNIIDKAAKDFDKFIKYEIRVATIKGENSHVEALGNIASYAAQRVKRLAFLASSVKNLSDVMLANQRSKRTNG